MFMEGEGVSFVILVPDYSYGAEGLKIPSYLRVRRLPRKGKLS